MSIIHRIKLPASDNWRKNVVSDLGEWECCANEEHSFYEPMVSLSIQINADHTLHMFCEADQVDAAVAMLRDMLAGANEGHAA